MRGKKILFNFGFVDSQIGRQLTNDNSELSELKIIA